MNCPINLSSWWLSEYFDSHYRWLILTLFSKTYSEFLLICLTHCRRMDCCNRAPQTGQLEQHLFLRVQDQGARRPGVWWRPAPWFADGCLVPVSSHGAEQREKSLVSFSFCKGINPYKSRRLQSHIWSNPKHLQRLHLLIPLHCI